MRFAALVGYALTTAVILTGCSGSGGSQGISNPLTAQNVGGSAPSSQSRTLAARTLVARHGVVAGSHKQLANQSGVGAVYVSDAASNALFGYALTGGTPMYTVGTGLNEPQGLTSHGNNVYVANTEEAQILVFTPPSTTPTQTIADTGEFPVGVAVNAAGTQVWVSNICGGSSCSAGNLQEYSGSGNLIQTITCADLYRYYFVGIDASGNVAVDGSDASGGPHVDLIPVGSSTCTSLGSILLQFPGGVEFTSTGDLAVDDQDANTVTTWTAPNFTSSSSTTSLGTISDPVSFAFGQGDANLWTANAGSANATQFAYPAGGSPTVTITSDLAEPIGVAVTGKAKCKGKQCHHNRPPEIFNLFEQYPCTPSGPCPTNFEVVFDGNMTSSIPTTEPLYGPYNPFCPVGQGPSNPCPPTVTYNPSTTTPCGTNSPTGSTTVTYAGPTLIEGNSPSEPGEVHFGLLGSQDQLTWLNKLCAYFTYPSSPQVAQPIVSINSTQPATSTNWKYAVVYFSGSTSPSGSYQYATWNEIAYDAGATDASGQPKITFENYGTQPIYVLNSGIVTGLPVPTDSECESNPACPEDMQLLGALDEAGFAPPDSSGSQFIPLQHPPKKVLKPKNSGAP